MTVDEMLRRARAGLRRLTGADSWEVPRSARLSNGLSLNPWANSAGDVRFGVEMQ
jgi:hypothetical protein